MKFYSIFCKNDKHSKKIFLTGSFLLILVVCDILGETWQSKVTRLRKKMEEKKTTVMVLSLLDDVACKLKRKACCILQYFAWRFKLLRRSYQHIRRLAPNLNNLNNSYKGSIRLRCHADEAKEIVSVTKHTGGNFKVISVSSYFSSSFNWTAISDTCDVLIFTS